MEGELTVARDIQRGIVPSIFPPFPEREEFDLHASLESAREVGGDLYDFFLLDEDHLCLAIGDVSGKGVPASLFMAVTITLLRAVGHRVGAPDEVLARLNAALCRGNDSAMFVTLFFAICDLRTGELEYACGGHPPPYVVRADGRVEELPQAHGVGLGVSERARYDRLTATLEPGDCHPRVHGRRHRGHVLRGRHVRARAPRGGPGARRRRAWAPTSCCRACATPCGTSPPAPSSTTT